MIKTQQNKFFISVYIFVILLGTEMLCGLEKDLRLENPTLEFPTLEFEDLAEDEECDRRQNNDKVFSNDKQREINKLFHGYIYGLLSMDVDSILSVTGDMLSFPLYSRAMDKEEQYEFFCELFATYLFNKVSIEVLYCLNTKKIVKISENRILLSIISKKTSPYVLKNWNYWQDFWGLTHYYFFEKVNEKWKLIAFEMDYNEELL